MQPGWTWMVQGCTCCKWVHLGCSLLFLSKFNTLSSSHSWCCPPCWVPASHTFVYCSFLFRLSRFYTFTIELCPSGLPSVNAALPPYPRLQKFHPLSTHFVSPLSSSFSPPHASCYSLIPLAFSSSPDSLRVLQ